MAKTSAKQTLEKSKSEYPFSSINNILSKLSSYKNFRSSKIFYIIILLAAVILLAFYKKNWFIAATVNGSPITNLELQMQLNKQFKTQTLNQLINEKIILDEAAKNNVSISDLEVNNKISEIETNVGGAQALDSLLSQQGQNRDSIKKQLKLQLAIEKLYSNEATVSAEEVAKFLEQNKDQLRASDSAGQQKESYDAIKNQKLSQIFNQKFQDLRQNAKIQTF